MTIEDVKITIKNHILNSISHQNLCVLCNIFEIPTTGRRGQIQKRLIDSILLTTNVDLLHSILYMINRSVSRDNSGMNQMAAPQTRDIAPNFAANGNNNTIETDRPLGYNQMNGYTQRTAIAPLNSKLYCISSELLDRCPINLRPEIIPGVDPLNIFLPNYTKYPTGFFNAPSTAPTNINGRLHLPNVQLPYCVKNTVIAPSPFYCCQVILHPLCLLIPKPTPNLSQPTRQMSKMQLQFTLSNNARHLITAHRSQINNKRLYKWQVLIRFGMYDPSKPFPSATDQVSNLPEYIPPYLTLFVNNVPVPLWDILPSNAPAKEGKRHARPINISDHLKFASSDEQGYRQSINVNWWQTPGVYQYYYFAVYLERKLAVDELYYRFVNKTHQVQMPISFTINLIRDKFSTNSQFHKKIDESAQDDDDDDLVMSSVLPISLLCPVGKSRITCPIRGVHCQHLQCFDAKLYLMMNERRSVWKCPVCDAQATLNELFVDEFFLQILSEFSNNDELTEVNVNPDGSYVPVAVKESREHKQHVGNIISNVAQGEGQTQEKSSPDNSNSSEMQECILVDTDDDNNDSDEDEEDSPTDLGTRSPKKLVSAQSKSSTVNSNHSSDSGQNRTVKTPNPSLTIDLTSDTDDDDVPPTPTIVMPTQPNISTQQLTTSTNSQPMPQHSFPPLFSHNVHHPMIAPKLPTNNFAKIPIESAHKNLNTLNYHPSSSHEPISNPFQGSLSNSITTQSMNKMPPYLWMQQNQMFNQSRTDLLNCFMPPIKPRFPGANFLNLPTRHPASNSSYQELESVASSSAPLLPKPIKTDPHLNLDIRFKESKPFACNASVAPSKAPPQNIAPPEKKSKQIRQPSSSANRRSSRILNQNRKVYKERSVSDDEIEESCSDESEVLASTRYKRKNIFDDSLSSNSSFSNRKRRRLIPDASSSSSVEENNNKETVVRQSDVLMTDLKCPIVILHKLDPVLLKVYLQQNELNGIDGRISDNDDNDDDEALRRERSALKQLATNVPSQPINHASGNQSQEPHFKDIVSPG